MTPDTKTQLQRISKDLHRVHQIPPAEILLLCDRAANAIDQALGVQSPPIPAPRRRAHGRVEPVRAPSASAPRERATVRKAGG